MVARTLRAGCQCIKSSFHCIGSRCLSTHSVVFEDVHCYGSLVMKCQLVSAYVKPINPYNVTDTIKSYITIKTSAHNRNLENLFSIEYDKDTSVINIVTDKDHLASLPDDVSIHVQVPHIYNLDINALAVDVEATEGDVLNLTSQTHCNLGNIKSNTSNIVSNGAITCKNFFGDAYMQTNSAIQIKKVQAQTLQLDAECVDISACYTPHFECQTIGKINIENLHGTTKLFSQNGPIHIASSEGDLNIETKLGNVDVTVERCEKIVISSGSGDISIGVGDEVSAFIEAAASYIDVPEDFLVDGMKQHSSSGRENFEGCLGNGKASINATTEGNISFSRKSWISKFQFIDE